VVGGDSNTAAGNRTFIGGGTRNTSSGNYNMVVGGVDNSTSSGTYSALVGGRVNSVTGGCSFLGGGQSNIASGGFSFVGTGTNSCAVCNFGFMGNGCNNVASGCFHGTVVNGQGNTATANYNFVGNGLSNVASGTQFNVVVGGRANTASGDYASVLGGCGNTASAACSTVLGGWANSISGVFSGGGGCCIAGACARTFYWNNFCACSCMWATAYFETSDERLKNIHRRVGSFDNISTIVFKWNDKRDDKVHWGYSAQEVQKHIPDAVSVGGDGTLSVDYNQIHSYKIAQLEQEVQGLKEIIKTLIK
jgi:hypothetical protein